MINNDTNFLLSTLRGRDAGDVASFLLTFAIILFILWKIRLTFNQYVKSRLKHMESDLLEKQQLISLVTKCEKRITDLETKQASDSQQSILYIQSLQKYIEDLSSQIHQINQKLDSANTELLSQKAEANSTKINELRDRLLQSYRYYTAPNTNASLSWNEMEADAFWAMFADYEKRGGNGYMHTEVEAAMRALPIVTLFDNSKN